MGFDLVLFGGTGDLAWRKLMPALFQAFRHGTLPEGGRILCVARDDLSDDQYRALIQSRFDGVELSKRPNPEEFARFADLLHYLRMDLSQPADYGKLAQALAARAAETVVMYVATAPSLFTTVCEQIAAVGLNGPRTRVVLEKPLGHDLASNQAINATLRKVLREEQVFRIDHYLGKPSVQNLLALRFGNALFEPLWRRETIANIQITIAEELGVESRGAFYDQTGALRDMVQNHALQLLCAIGMEPPINASAHAIRDEKLKVLQSLRPWTPETLSQHVVRGQYLAGASQGQPVSAYQQEKGVAAGSQTETFVALRTEICNWRWAGVPFYLRTGKRLARKTSEILIQFKPVPHQLFGGGEANRLLIRLQPEERISLQLMGKSPGKGMHLQPVELDLNLADAFHKQRRWDAYERLLLDVIEGDSTLFMRRDEVEAAWNWVDPIIKGWHQHYQSPRPYPAGSDGPEQAGNLLERHERQWME